MQVTAELGRHSRKSSHAHKLHAGGLTRLSVGDICNWLSYLKDYGD